MRRSCGVTTCSARLSRTVQTTKSTEGTTVHAHLDCRLSSPRLHAEILRPPWFYEHQHEVNLKKMKNNTTQFSRPFVGAALSLSLSLATGERRGTHRYCCARRFYLSPVPTRSTDRQRVPKNHSPTHTHTKPHTEPPFFCKRATSGIARRDKKELVA